MSEDEPDYGPWPSSSDSSSELVCELADTSRQLGEAIGYLRQFVRGCAQTCGQCETLYERVVEWLEEVG